MNDYFQYDEKLGIHVPNFDENWALYNEEKKEEILFEWEKIRGMIPERIKELEKIINYKQKQLENEGDFEKSCQLNEEIAEIASAINDLWLWFRTDEATMVEGSI